MHGNLGKHETDPKLDTKRDLGSGKRRREETQSEDIAPGATTCWNAEYNPVLWVLLVGAGVHFLKVSDPGCVEDFVDLDET